MAILVSNKIDLKTKFVPRNKKRGGQNNKGDNPLGRQNNYKHNASNKRVPQNMK